MPYKISGVNGLNAEGLSLKEARKMVKTHLETLEDKYIQSNSLVVGGKLENEIHFVIDNDLKEDGDLKSDGKIELAKIEYVKGGEDALPRNDS
jgi:hypothetical protein